MRYARRRALLALAGAAIAAGFVLADHYGLFGRAPEPDLRKYHGRTFVVVRAVDGDTFDLDVPDGARPHTRVRLWGVDTPETVKPRTATQHFGPEASAFTQSVTLGRPVRLELVPGKTRDRVSTPRLLAYVSLPDGRLLNQVLVEEGYAYADWRYDHPRMDDFVRAQAKAMRARVGLWRSVQRKDIPPYWLERFRLPAPSPATPPSAPARP